MKDDSVWSVRRIIAHGRWEAMKAIEEKEEGATSPAAHLGGEQSLHAYRSSGVYPAGRDAHLRSQAEPAQSGLGSELG